jgi:hypothetical protein
MTARARSLPFLVMVAAMVLTGCGGGSSTKPTAQERDLGPVSTKVLGGAADSQYLHVFSAAITVDGADAPRFSATLLYVGTGSDRLVHVATPLGDATLAQPLEDDSAVPINVALAGSRSGRTTVGSTVAVSVRLAQHGTVGLVVPLVGPIPTPATSS